MRSDVQSSTESQKKTNTYLQQEGVSILESALVPFVVLVHLFVFLCGLKPAQK